MRSHPAAKHNGSPTTGSHDRSNSGLPQGRSHDTARCLCGPAWLIEQIAPSKQPAEQPGSKRTERVAGCGDGEKQPRIVVLFTRRQEQHGPRSARKKHGRDERAREQAPECQVGDHVSFATLAHAGVVILGESKARSLFGII